MRKFLVLSALGLLSAPVLAQTVTKQPQPGFNLFSVSQDIEIGRQSAAEAERQLPLLRNNNVDSYLNRVVQRLAAVAPGARYPYQIKAVNASEINAFALPGGPMYVNRGLIETARSEAELAGVLAHEMSHVALRHGTHQASKAYLTRSGLGILGGLLGKPAGGTAQILNTIGGVGLNALFLKFSRNDEYEADQVGQQIMAKAGYDPLAMATLFELLRAEQGRNPSKLEQFFSSHPSSANREARLRQYATSLGSGKTEVVGNFTTIRTGLRRLPLPSSQQVTQTAPPAQEPPAIGQVAVQVAAPSSRFLRFEHSSGFFAIDHPDNWNVYPSGLAVSMAPEGGVVNASDGRQVLLYGVIVNHYTPFAGAEERRSLSLERSYAPFEDRTKPRGTLEDATDDLVRTILSANSYLRAEAGSARSEVIDAAPGFSVVLSGVSPVTGEEERVRLYTRGLPDGHVIYALFTAPARNYDEVAQTFGRMLRTLVVNDAAAHRVTSSEGNPLH
ncbi:MAG TPA: M48 family metallopeptidase [Gemmatimonadales bacterium]|jgi:Zn-dependent protease with chaperone function|nr:M48 family metallopeptidase [Gemmatimonadales bacterium]